MCLICAYNTVKPAKNSLKAYKMCKGVKTAQGTLRKHTQMKICYKVIIVLMLLTNWAACP